MSRELIVKILLALHCKAAPIFEHTTESIIDHSHSILLSVSVIELLESAPNSFNKVRILDACRGLRSTYSIPV